MTLNTYDVLRHHIGLKALGGATNYGFQIHGAYDKELQREAAAAREFGGNTDLIGQSPSLARVTQDDFVGGAYQYTWGRDDAMFADCTNFMPSQQSRSLISVPPMFLKFAFDPDVKDDFVSDTVLNMFMVGGSIYVVFRHGILRQQIDSGTQTWRGSEAGGVLDTDGTETIVSAYYDPELEDILIALNDSTADAYGGNIARLNLDLTDASVAFYPGPVTPNQYCRGFALMDSNYILQVGQNLWSGVPPANMNTVASEIAWTKIGRLPGRWIDSMIYGGELYIVLNENVSAPSYHTRLVRFDGSNIAAVADMPFNFYGRCITEYAGRIYLGGTGTDSNGGEQYGELYEITGSSQRLVRSFSPETRNAFLGGTAGEWPQAIQDLCVFEGMLWFGQLGKRMMAYDITSDGIFGASEIQSNADLDFKKIIAGRGRLWAWGYDPTSDLAHGIYRIAQPADTISTWYATLVTSDFAFEPAMKKRWSELVVMTRYDGLQSIEYSVNSGGTWTALTLVEESSNNVYYTTADLNAITPSRLIRFRIKLKCAAGGAGDARTYHRELVALSFSYAMLETGKRSWSFVINGAYEVETRDAELDEDTTQTQDMSDTATTLWGWATGKTQLVFTDVDGSTANVQMIGIREHQPVIGPNITGESRPEALYSVVLLEA